VASIVERIGAGVIRALPDGWVARLVGAPTVIRGRTLDPHLALLVRAAAGRPGLHTQTPAEARASTDDALALAAAPNRPLECIEEHRIPGADGPLVARLHVPPRLDGPRPLILYFHQGGCVIGNLDWCESFCSVLATGARVPVLSVDYRKGPEHRFPAAQEDAWAAYCWAREHAGDVGGDPTRVGVGGDSAGGGLAAMIAQRAKAESAAQPAFQLLIYPWLLAYADNDAYRDFGSCYPLVAASMQWFIDHYLNDDAEREDARLSPGLTRDLTGLAPALVYTAGFDLLCDEGEDYAKRLEAAGVPVIFRCYESLTHSFTSFGGAAPAAAQALDEIAHDVDRVLSQGGRLAGRPTRGEPASEGGPLDGKGNA
jgi:acetyl esterase/lipase